MAAYSSTNLEKTYNPTFYKLLIYLAPIILSTCALAYIDYSRGINRVLFLFITLCMSISIIINLQFYMNYIGSRSGIPRIMNVYDKVSVLEKLPNNSTLCSPRDSRMRDYKYIDRYITKKDLKFGAACQPDSYVIFPKYESLSNYKLKKANIPADRSGIQRESKLIHETALYQIFQF